jgi:hypothetical protein
MNISHLSALRPCGLVSLWLPCLSGMSHFDKKDRDEGPRL